MGKIFDKIDSMIASAIHLQDSTRITTFRAIKAEFLKAKTEKNAKPLDDLKEFQIINKLHSSFGKVDYVIINPAAFTHTSVAIRDALLAVKIPFFEVHISNVHAREEFRNHSFLSDIATGVICGFGPDGYEYALRAAIKKLS